MPDIPTNNIELYLANIAGESEQMPDFPTNKIERYLAKIAENGGGGGGGGGEGPQPYTSSPAMDGAASAGSSAKYARGDHVHPTDTSRAAATDLAAKADKVTEVTNTDTAPDVDLDPEKIYHFTGALTALTITLNAPASGQLAHYHFDFDSGSTAPTLTLPNTVTMPGGFAVGASKHYEIDILNNYGTVMAW